MIDLPRGAHMAPPAAPDHSDALERMVERVGLAGVLASLSEIVERQGSVAANLLNREGARMHFKNAAKLRLMANEIADR